MILKRVKIKPRWAAWALIGVCSLVLFIRYPAKAGLMQNGIPGDFAVYLRAWERVIQGQDPYVVSDFSPYKYAPGALAVISALPRDPSSAWFVFGLLSIVALAYALGSGGGKYATWKSVGLLATGLALSWKGILEILDYGQIELLILAIAVGGAQCFNRAPFASGLLLGFLPGLKLPWILFFFPFLIRASNRFTGTKGGSRYFKSLFSGYFIAWFLWAAAVPSLMFGPERAKVLSQSWVRLLQLQPHEMYLSDINQGLLSSALRGTGESQLLSFALFLIALGGVVGLLSVRLRKIGTQTPALLWISPWLLLSQLANPLAWRWGSVFALGIPLGADERVRPKKSSRVLEYALWGLIFIFWLLQQNPVARALGFSHWADLHGYGIITYYWLALILA